MPVACRIARGNVQNFLMISLETKLEEKKNRTRQIMERT